MNSTKPITTQQIIKFNALLRNLGLELDTKRDLIFQYSKGRSDKTNDLTLDEASRMIKYLDNLTQPNQKKEAEKESCQRQRRKIIHFAYQLGWTSNETGKVDMDRLNQFLIKRGAVRSPKIKTINDYNSNDLRRIVTQFQELYKNHLKQFNK